MTSAMTTHAPFAKRAGARVFERTLESFAAQRNFALTHVQTLWVLFIDSDERVSPALAAEIQEAVRDETVAGYWIPRKNLFKGRWVRHAGWGPDYQLRLFRVAQGRYDPSRFAHETVLLDGPDKRLTELLTHYNYSSVRQFVAKQQRYAQLEARRLWLDGQRVRWRNYILQPLRAFNRRFFTWQGYARRLAGIRAQLCNGLFRMAYLPPPRRFGAGPHNAGVAGVSRTTSGNLRCLRSNRPRITWPTCS